MSVVGVFEEDKSLPKQNMILRNISPCASKHLVYYSVTYNNI